MMRVALSWQALTIHGPKNGLARIAPGIQLGGRP
jgi:hypothetical protein